MLQLRKVRQGEDHNLHGVDLPSQWEVWDCESCTQRAGDLQEEVISGDDDGKGDFAYSR